MAEIDIENDTLDRVMLHNRLKMMKILVYWIVKATYYNLRIKIDKLIMAVFKPKWQ